MYGYDNDSYKQITQLDKSFKIVKRNVINFLISRNEINKNLKVGFNFIILPENYNIVKALLGDHSDNLPGVKGLGIKTIMSEWKSFAYDSLASLQDVWDHCETQLEQDKPKKIFAKIIHNWDKVLTNFELMDLHKTVLDKREINFIEETLQDSIPDLQTGAFLHLLDQDKIEGVTKNTEGWLDNFKGLTTVS